MERSLYTTIEGTIDGISKTQDRYAVANIATGRRKLGFSLFFNDCDKLPKIGQKVLVTGVLNGMDSLAVYKRTIKA